MNLDHVEVVLAVAVIILSIFSLVSEVRKDLKDVGMLRFRWVYLIILGVMFISISNILRITGEDWRIRYILLIIGGTCVLAALFARSRNRSKQQQ